MAKKTTKKKKSTKKASANANVDASGKHLVIVESPTKAKTINRYLGSDYVVMASVGHVRDLPSRAPKGKKQVVPGVDLENDFEPTYDILPDKKKTVAALKKAAKQAQDVWFATDLDREGEAIAWHLAQALGVPDAEAKRVVFNAITKDAISRAFDKPRNLDVGKVDAQQARRILDRIVGYQVSPFLWKKVAGKLSAGRVQSVATRLVVEREREIEAFIPDEYWRLEGIFSVDMDKAAELASGWHDFLVPDDEGKKPTLKDQLKWLNERRSVRAELVSFAGKPFKPDNHEEALNIAQQMGFDLANTVQAEDPKAKGPAKNLVELEGKVASDAPAFAIESIETRRTTARPPGPFITSTLQQTAANRLSFALQQTMRVAQQLYEGVDIKGEGQVGLITYMRTDSTHLSGDALNMVRGFIDNTYGEKYLPEKPNFFSSSNKSAQEAHEAIRPTDVNITPSRVRQSLTDQQYKLYKLIWERFVACQMPPAKWDSTTVMIVNDAPAEKQGKFKATGRTLVFDGFYKAAGIPTAEDAILPPMDEGQPMAPLDMTPTQHFTSPPPRYSEASLQKRLEQEGIGRPSTYAAIIQTIQDRKYVEQVAPRDRRLMATDLGKVVTDMLVEAFPNILDVAYTRKMETELDQIEEEHQDWRAMLREFYGPFVERLKYAHEEMQHAKAAQEPAPHKCPKCGSGTVYRFGKNGRFLSCDSYPDCDYAAPIDREGNPQEPEVTDVVCPECNDASMTRRTGRFGPFLGCKNYPECKGILNLDRKTGGVKLPKTPPLTTDVPCPKCEAPLYLRESKRGLWMSCSKFPKCRGREGFAKLEEDKQKELEKAWEKHMKENPLPTVKNTSGDAIAEGYLPEIAGEAVESK